MIGSKLAQREAFVNHLGECENGWINGADLVFQSKKTTGDYYDEMN